MSLQHCAKSENISRLRFARATYSPDNLPLTFKQVDNFTFDTSCGVIEMDSFFGEAVFAVIQEGSDDRMYIIIPFYLSQDHSTYEIHLVATWNTKAHIYVSVLPNYSHLTVHV